MKKKKTKIIVGAVCMAVGLGGSTLQVDNPMHYFGVGSIFGIGLTLLVSGIKSKNKG